MLFDSNLKAVSSQTKFLDAEARTFLSTLQEFVAVSNQHTTGTMEQTNNFHKKRSDALAVHLSLLDNGLTAIQARLRAVQAKDNVAAEQVASVRTAVNEMQEHVKIGFTEWSTKVASGFEALCKEIEKNGAASCSLVSSIVFFEAGILMQGTPRLRMPSRRSSLSLKRSLAMHGLSLRGSGRLRKKSEIWPINLRKTRLVAYVGRMRSC